MFLKKNYSINHLLKQNARHGLLNCFVILVQGYHNQHAGLPEWSKGVDLRPTALSARGFEPHSLQYIFIFLYFVNNIILFL